MKIFVCIKSVIDEAKAEIDSNGNIKRESLSLKLNKADEYAIENALLLKDKYKFETIAITMGPQNSQDILKYVFSKGVDKTILISDPLLKGSDCLITSKVLSTVINKIAEKDFIVFCGVSSEDGHTSIVPPQISYFLNIPFVFGVRRVDLVNDKLLLCYKDDSIISVNIPAVVSIDISNEIKPRIAPINLRLKAKNYIPDFLSLNDIGLNNVTAKESPTSVASIEEIKTNFLKNTRLINIENPNDLNEIKKLIYE